MPDLLKVTIKRSGGVAGMTQNKTINTSELDNDQLTQLTTAISELPTVKNDQDARDAFVYDVTIETHAGITEATLSGERADAVVGPLLQL